MGELTTKETINNNYNNLIQQHCACNNTARAQGKQHYTILHSVQRYYTTLHYTQSKQYYEKNIYHYYPMYRGHGRCYCTDTLDRTNHQS